MPTKFNAVVKADGFTVTPLGAGGEFQLTGGNIGNGGTLTLRGKTLAGTLNGVRVGDVIFQDAGKALASGTATGGTLFVDPTYTRSGAIAGSDGHASALLSRPRAR